MTTSAEINEHLSMETEGSRSPPISERVEGDLLTTPELIELCATGMTELIRRRAAAALYAQGHAHANRTMAFMMDRLTTPRKQA